MSEILDENDSPVQDENDSPVLDEEMILAGGYLAHVADGNLVLAQGHGLLVADAFHAHLADIAGASSNRWAEAVDSILAHAADAVALTGTHILVVAEAFHAQAATGGLWQAHTLIVAEAYHASAADGDLVVENIYGQPAIAELEDRGYLGLCLNLKGNQLSQWANYNFNSMAKIGNQYVGAGEGGLFTLDSGDYDSGMPIEAFFELATSDWGIPEQKRIRAMYFGYESDGNLMVTVKDDDGTERSFSLSPNHTANLQHGAKVNGARDGKGRYWMIRIDNVNGSDFSVDSIQVLPIVLNRRPSAA